MHVFVFIFVIFFQQDLSEKNSEQKTKIEKLKREKTILKQEKKELRLKLENFSTPLSTSVVPVISRRRRQISDDENDENHENHEKKNEDYFIDEEIEKVRKLQCDNYKKIKRKIEKDLPNKISQIEKFENYDKKNDQIIKKSQKIKEKIQQFCKNLN